MKIENKKTALLFGSTGLVGSELMHILLDSPNYSRLRIFVRKTIPLSHPKLEQVIIDFDNSETIEDSIKGDEIFICLGTTMAKAGSKDAFYKVDYTYCYNVAKLASNNGVKRILLISSMGANVDSMIYYSKVKGEIERDICNLSFESVDIIRPSLLLGNRSERRPGEKLFSIISRSLGFMYAGPFKKYAPIEAKTVAKAMVQIAASRKNGVHIFESAALQELGNVNN
ncbi:MAG: oxidoreductase [Saprospiraceae bacterium]|nr:oxidoreductase [Saprospiraceae bacterium]